MREFNDARHSCFYNLMSMFARCMIWRTSRFHVGGLLTKGPKTICYEARASHHAFANNLYPRKRPLATSHEYRARVSPHTQVNAILPLSLQRIQTRPFSLSSITSLLTSLPLPLVPPTIFLTLLITLWTWKCLWIIILQDKLLYLSWLPPLSRSEEVSDYKSEFRGVEWREGEIRSLDGVRLTLVEGRYGRSLYLKSKSKGDGEGSGGEGVIGGKRRKRVVIVYFQGNGGSTPLRLPLLSQTLRAIHEHATSNSISIPATHSNSDAKTNGKTELDTEYILTALSYRGYWKSKGRATQSGIQKDAQAFLNWAAETYAEPNTELSVVLWGHSLGAAVASDALVRRLSTSYSTGVSRTNGLEVDGTETEKERVRAEIKGLILEAPISSIKDMLISLYPQKWLPYRYLWPFSWNNWDVAKSLEHLSHHRRTASALPSTHGYHGIPPILLLSAESDEVIPTWVADQLEEKAKSVGLQLKRKDVKGAMHIECPLKHGGKKALVEFILGPSSSHSSSSSPDANADANADAGAAIGNGR